MMAGTNIIVLDNGASTIKAGLANSDYEHPRIIPNAVVRSKGDKTTYIGHEFEQCQDHASLHYRLPFEKGLLVDWDAQKAIWDGLFSNQCLGINTTESSLLITEPYFNLPNMQEVYDQFMFEEYDFESYYRCAPASLIPHGKLFSELDLPPAECILIVDSGFSYTHVVPLLHGSVVWRAVKRLDVGGKLLTNHLKELVSFRQWNMMDETYIMNDVKESCCYVSVDFRQDLEACRVNPQSNSIVREYILPDLTKDRRGRLRQAGETLTEGDQVLLMNNERFAVPEIVFRPDDIGLEQPGLAAVIAISISFLPQDLQGMFWSNISLIGGNTKFPGFRRRLIDDLRSLAPVEYDVSIVDCVEPITEAYKSAFAFATKSDGQLFKAVAVTREEYAESGSNASLRKFASSDWQAGGIDHSTSEAIQTRPEEDRAPQLKKLSRTRSKTVPSASTTRRR
ncbi:Actin- protein 6 [Pleurotus pulmonarius]|nr:Actin- protein 6 [Pleurotus pulmonarius]KAF4590751.1 Actin- protein 6 [Pleurotus pulmonarius]